MAELSPQPASIQTIYSWYREQKLYVNRRYQRKLVWTLEEKKRLIESISKKYPVPAIILAERSDETGTFEIIDGLQRLHTIVSFIETSFENLDGRVFDVGALPTAKNAADEKKFEIRTSSAGVISPKEVSTILDYSLPISIMRDAADEEINDVFGRINTYGHRLSDQERRQAGVGTEFSNLVRDIACDIRGDVSKSTLPLFDMPSISIDLPKTRHGYQIEADEVFWVAHGILHSTDLRDSMDEQSIADIAACIIGAAPIDRSKEAMDAIYGDEQEVERLANALTVYGADKFREEFLFCIELIETASAAKGEKLRSLIFRNRTTNPFPSVFAPIFIAVHSLVVAGNRPVSAVELGNKIENIAQRINIGKAFTSSEERKSNVDAVKGILSEAFVSDKDLPAKIYHNHSAVDIDNTIRRSIVEVSNYDLKQGLVRLDGSNTVDETVIEKVITTAVGIANIGSQVPGRIVIGVADKQADAERVAALHGVQAKEVGGRFVVGVAREAKALNESVEKYVHRWRDGISNASINDALKSALLSSLDFNNYYGLGILVVVVPPQKEMSTYANKVFARDGDQTVEVADPKMIGEIARRF